MIDYFLSRLLAQKGSKQLSGSLFVELSTDLSTSICSDTFAEKEKEPYFI